MLPVMRLDITGCLVAGILCLALPSQTSAAKALSSQIETQVLNLIASRNLGADQCIATSKMSELVGAHPELAQQILEFASANLASRRNPLADDCTCPTELAVATIRAVPDMAGPLRRVLEGRYPECDSAVETAMEQSLGGIAPGAGNVEPSANPTLPRDNPTDETCRDTTVPGCGARQNLSANGAGSSQTSGLTSGSSAKSGNSATDLPPGLQAEILEALEADPQRQNQCIAANAFSALVKAHPELALAIMEFADVKLSSKGRILGDECVCPIELATATVDAVPELKIPVRRALDDRYPECTEPAAEGRSRRLAPEPSCHETASPSC